MPDINTSEAALAGKAVTATLGTLEPPPQQLFTFNLTSFEIKNTRSLHEDTDYVTFTLLVRGQDGGGQPRSLTKSMGDVNNGTHIVGLSFQNLEIEPSDTVVLNYLIVNSGHKNPSEVETALESAAVALATKGAQELGNAILPGIGSILGIAAGWLFQKLVGVLTANCDGPVAAEQVTFSCADLMAKTPDGSFDQSTTHNGSDSPVGCGSNSVYIVDWGILNVEKMAAKKVVPNVLNLPMTEAGNAVHAAGLVAKFSGSSGPRSWVIYQSPTAGERVDAGTAVNMSLSTSPMR
jgi:hypothetical protein